ncbi:hypothetical protein [Azospirillum himalayense]|uniref:Uncharacterized protein n=1 Tax=Azospirillum himalayense TaxID=654847 RepID=A0ABW0G5L8_9PROT
MVVFLAECFDFRDEEADFRKAQSFDLVLSDQISEVPDLMKASLADGGVPVMPIKAVTNREFIEFAELLATLAPQFKIVVQRKADLLRFEEVHWPC